MVDTWTNERIRSLRLSLGWSQAELARQLGCASSLILSWEMNEEAPTHHYRIQLDLLKLKSDQWIENLALISPEH